jgi:transcriptional regulator with GAF, ATPase, and Fis domain
LPESDRAAFSHLGVRSGIVLPVVRPDDGDGAATALALGSLTREQRWTPALIEPLQLLAGVLRQACARRATHLALQRALEDVRQLRDRAAENHELRREVKGLRTSRSIVSGSAAIQAALAQIDQVAPTPATVLLLGETGTGKDVMAQAIHDLSPRRRRQMIRVSCAAIPTALIESELFGRERGAYTGALSRQIGRFEAANQSTLFLDEIGELPLEVQVKLLRVLQERVIERLGSTQTVKVDVRIIAATNRNLEDAVRDKAFREDLYYRLNVFPVVVPPLRERVEDIPALVWSFIDEFSQAFGKTIESISKASMSELQRYPWPGNVRELRNVIERAVILANDRQLVVGAPRLGERPLRQDAMTLMELEMEHIRTVLHSTGWRVRGAGGPPRAWGQAHDAREPHGETRNCAEARGRVARSRLAWPGRSKRVAAPGAHRRPGSRLRFDGELSAFESTRALMMIRPRPERPAARSLIEADARVGDVELNLTCGAPQHGADLTRAAVRDGVVDRFLQHAKDAPSIRAADCPGRIVVP